MEPPRESRICALKTATPNLADKPPLAGGPPFTWVIEQRCLEYWYTKLGRQTYFGRWTPSESRIDALNAASPNLADEHTLANDPPPSFPSTDIYWSRMAISHCY